MANQKSFRPLAYGVCSPREWGNIDVAQLWLWLVSRWTLSGCVGQESCEKRNFCPLAILQFLFPPTYKSQEGELRWFYLNRIISFLWRYHLENTHFFHSLFCLKGGQPFPSLWKFFLYFEIVIKAILAHFYSPQTK